MRYASPLAFRTALETRLRNSTTHSDLRLARLRKLVVFDRVLARLVIVAPQRWLLKGALALDFRLGEQYRTTRDMDLWHADSLEAAAADIVSVTTVDLGDYFQFGIDRASESNPGGVPVAHFLITANLAGRRFETFNVDITIADPPLFPPEHLTSPNLLNFAGIPSVEFLAVPLEQQIAEKVHAYSQTYSDGRSSTRVKDLVDLVLVRSLKPFRAGDLRRALDVTFGVRNTAPPSSFPPPPANWATVFARLADEVRMSRDLALAYALAAAFRDPILSKVVSEGSHWDPEQLSWP